MTSVGPWLGEHIRPRTPTFHFFFTGLDPQADAHEIGQFLVSLGGPILLSLATVAIVRRRPFLPRWIATSAIAFTQGLLIVLVAACLERERRPELGLAYFSTRTLAVSALGAVLLFAATRSARLRLLLSARAQEGRARRWAVAGLAALATAIWLLPTINSDDSIGWAVEVTQYHTAFYLDEAFALLNGLTPLVSFTPQYGAIWPYVMALPLLAFGKSLLAFTLAMSVASAASLLGLFGILRRVTRNSIAALLLFLPVLATILIHIGETPDKPVTVATYFAYYPLRFAGPLLLGWLTARHLSKPDPERPWPLFLFAGVVAVNNVDMGVAATGATLAALMWARWPRGRAQALALSANVAAGLALALMLVSAVTLAHSGSLPQPQQLTEFARVFALNGYAAVPMAGVLGLPLLIYGTLAATIVVATVRALNRERDLVLTGMLAWTGVFGLGAAMYFVARDVLPTTFGAWALAIALLTVTVLRSLAARPRRAQAAMALVVLFGIGVAACSIAQMPLPWREVARLRANAPPLMSARPLAPPLDREVQRFVSGIADGRHRFVTRPGSPVAVLSTTGHRLADAYGIRNVAPYTGLDSILTAEQANHVLDTLRDAGGNTVLLPRTDIVPINQILLRRGFAVLTAAGLQTPRIHGARDFAAISSLDPIAIGGLVKWVDTRNLHARALR